MSSFSESEPVFASRCLKVGLSEADIAKLKEQGITTLAKVAFCCSYTPGSGDDSELIRALKDALGVDPVLGQKSAVLLCGPQPKIIPRNPLCGLRGLEAGSESIRRVSVRSSPKVIPRDRCLRAMAEILRKGLRGMRGWSERMSEFGSQEVVG